MSETIRDVAEQAEWLGISQKSVRRYAGPMGATRVGSRLLFRESDTLAFLESQRLAPRRRKERLKAVS